MAPAPEIPRPSPPAIEVDPGRDPVPFTALSARSRALVVGISAVLIIESAALHLLILRRWPWVSLVLALANLWTIWWFVQDYRAVADLPILAGESDVVVRLGKRLTGTVPYAAINAANRPTWQQIPESGRAGYIKLSGWDDPNVLLELSAPAGFRGPFGIEKRGSLVGLRLDEPDEFVRLVRERMSERRI
ncbi:MAG: hypothetical protein U0163_14120 [Gemmatimonadaceae bacterium]